MGRGKTVTDTVPQPAIRDRLRDLNTKAYYLLVALSFVYRTNSATWALKLAFALTAIVAVAPVQDFTDSVFWLKLIRNGKIALLGAALIFTLVWLCSETPN
jgi:hypothetical protein